MDLYSEKEASVNRDPQGTFGGEAVGGVEYRGWEREHPPVFRQVCIQPCINVFWHLFNGVSILYWH